MGAISNIERTLNPVNVEQIAVPHYELPGSTHAHHSQ